MADDSVKKTATSIVARLAAGESYTTADVVRWKHDRNLTAELIEVLRGRPVEVRKAALPLLAELARPLLPAEGELPERLAPFMDDESVVAYLVALLDDADSSVRNDAATTLIDSVPDPLIRNHSPRIIESIRRHPATDGAVLLLGKTGMEMARSLILKTPDLHDADAEETRAALARLGDRRAEDAVLDAYRNASEPRAKSDAAVRLGYVATPRAVLALARDMRTAETYLWVRTSRRSMRVHVIEGLHRAFPTEPIFWPPFFTPENDSYYEAIEEWITRNLGMTWDRARPEFLYQEIAPIPSKD